MIHIHKKDARATKIDISFKCSATFIDSRVPHSSGKANLMFLILIWTLRLIISHEFLSYKI